MRLCTGCRHFRRDHGRCLWLSRHGRWESYTGQFGGRTRWRFIGPDGSVHDRVVWHPRVEDERSHAGRCGPNALLYERSWFGRLVDRLFGEE